MTPREAMTHKDVCSLPRDHFDVRDGWIILNGPGEIVICNQRPGQVSTGKVKLSKKQFNRLIDWYNTGKVSPRKAVGASGNTQNTMGSTEKAQ